MAQQDWWPLCSAWRIPGPAWWVKDPSLATASAMAKTAAGISFLARELHMLWGGQQ